MRARVFHAATREVTVQYVLDVLAFSHSAAARQPRGLVRFHGFDGILKVTDAIKDWAHGLGARRGRLCEGESGHCSAHLDGEMRTDDQGVFVLCPCSSIHHWAPLSPFLPLIRRTTSYINHIRKVTLLGEATSGMVSNQ